MDILLYLKSNYDFSGQPSGAIFSDITLSLVCLVLFYQEKLKLKSAYKYILFFFLNWAVVIVAKSIACACVESGFYSIYIDAVLIFFVCGSFHAKKMGVFNYILNAILLMSVYVYSTAILFPLIMWEQTFFEWDSVYIFAQLIQFVEYVSLAMLLRKFNVNCDSTGKKILIVFIGIITLIGFILSLLSNLFDNVIADGSVASGIGYNFYCNLFLLIIEACAYVLFLFLMNMNDKNAILERAQSHMSNELDMMRIYEKNYNDLREMRHDMRNTLNVIMGYAEEENCPAIINYLNELSDRSKVSGAKVYCENSVINVLLNRAKEQMDDGNIKSEFCIVLPKKINVSDLTLCSILGNMLNNAVEAAATFDGERYVFVSIQLVENNLVIHMENSTGKAVQIGKDGYPQTTKQDKDRHGIGLKIIKKAVEKNDGYFEFKQKDNVFTADAYIKCEQTEE